MDKDKVKVLAGAIMRQIYLLFGNDTIESQKAREAAWFLLDNADNFNVLCNTELESQQDMPDGIDNILGNLNEKGARRKKDGVFYTMPDVANFITANAFLKYICHIRGIEGTSSAIGTLSSLESREAEKLIEADVFDPTCGAGEFLISALTIKLEMVRERLDDLYLLKIAKSIHGNDIAADSVYISKIRIYLALLQYVSNAENITAIAEAINSNFTTLDFVNADLSKFKRYDIITGNPPYVEYRMLDYVPREQFGNAYANVLANSAGLVTDDGVIGFIVPISFVATRRMDKIREILIRDFSNICLLNYADRPDCLFAGVHQKLTIVIAGKVAEAKEILSSSYNYWYKQERLMLFDRCDLSPVNPDKAGCIPKIGNQIELSIYNKCLAGADDMNLYDSAVDDAEPGDDVVYLNMRNCFWIKAFSFNPGSSEYKRFRYTPAQIDFVRCVLNSSLFFFFWIAVSDCWHITSKELRMFKLPGIKGDSTVFAALFSELEKKLEETKIYVGTKQTEYEYKHKQCKDVIDRIDHAIAASYSLTAAEVEYLKSFILKYRLSDGA